MSTGRRGSVDDARTFPVGVHATLAVGTLYAQTFPTTPVFATLLPRALNGPWPRPLNGTTNGGARNRG